MLTVTTAVAAVLTFSALLGWLLLRAARSAERARQDPRYRRRYLLVHAAISAAGAVLWGVLGARGQPASQVLLCLFLALANVMSFINDARKLNTAGV
jgi:hypothetical protein